MRVTLTKKEINGRIPAIPSKSMAHRLLICAALSERPTKIRCNSLNADIEATVRCLQAMGADITYENGLFTVTPGKARHAVCDCGESGSTLRFLLPVICALGEGGEITMQGRLPQRPMSPLREELISGGCTISPPGENPMRVDGELEGGVYTIPGDISSQFISGLLFALPLTRRECRINITGRIESLPYIAMTLEALRHFNIRTMFREDHIIIPDKQLYLSPGTAYVEGDWSNAAFPLCAAALGGRVTLSGIGSSLQGDRRILSILRSFGAVVTENEQEVTVEKGVISPIKLDASDIPDLVPVIAVTAMAAKGDTVITGAARLRIKESDRIKTVCEMIRNLGGDATETEDGLTVHGTGCASGGTVSSHNDHRIAMSAAVASVLCDGPVTIEDAEAVNKSYPSFFEDFAKL